MATFNENQISEIKTRIDLIDLISSYGIQVSRTGNTAKCKCPFHNEKTPSFSIDANKGLYYCFGCGEAGDAIKFVQKHEGIDFPSAVRKLAEQCGIKLEAYESPMAKSRARLYGLMAELAQFYHRCLVVSKEGELARKYLYARNIDEQIWEKYIIGYAPSNIYTIYKWAQKYGYTEKDLSDAGVIKLGSQGTKPYYYFSGRLIFSVMDKAGRVVAFSGRQLIEDKKSGKYVNSPETIIFKKGKTLFGFDKASSKIVKDKNREVIICEGQIDCIRLQTNGFGNSVASQGTAFTEDHAHMLKRVADTAILCFDDDAAGHKATHKTAEILLAQNIPVRVVSLPDGDDPDTYIQTKGAEEFRALLDEGSESIVSFLARTFRAKETTPDSLEAQARITTVVLDAIAKCESPILRATMMKEASVVLDIDRSSIAEEIKAKVSDKKQTEDANIDEIADDMKTAVSETSLKAVDADKSVVSDTETALIRFLFDHYDDAVLRKAVGYLFPSFVFKSDLCARIVSAWQEDNDGVFSVIEKLSEADYRIFLSAIHTTPSLDIEGLTAAQSVFFYARQVWFEYLISLVKALWAEDRRNMQSEINGLCKILADMPNLGRKSFISFIEGFNHLKYEEMIAPANRSVHEKAS